MTCIIVRGANAATKGRYVTLRKRYPMTLRDITEKVPNTERHICIHVLWLYLKLPNKFGYMYEI